jgi:hypothetical protein
MRITDDRYTRDRLRLDLALRLIRHEARTCTIRGWTGLTDDRIRKLYKSYIEHAGRDAVRRHRGKAPKQAAYFLRNMELRLQSGTLATLMCSLGLFTPEAQAEPGALAQLRWGERFCEAYETYLGEFAEPRLGFEHACFLHRALERQAELAIDECLGCGALVVVSVFAPRPESCVFCGEGRQWSPSRAA